jgi:putative membrane protein
VNARKQATLRRAAAISGAIALVGFVTAAPAVGDGASGPVKVVNTETVKVYMGADGDIQSKRVYEQLALFGHGSVDVKNPVSTDGLRNLDGFSAFDVSGHDTVTKTTVDGTKRYRSVSTFDKALPVQITPSYRLNGKNVGPHGIVGKSGKLEVTYKVVNKTATSQEISIPDGSGGTVAKTVQVPVPMVGSLTTTLPKTFTNVEPNGANTAGDGAGGLTLSYTMTLFPPLGSDTATLHYAANITDGVVPETSVTLLPVDPLASPTFKTAADSYQGGASTGAELLSGATTIDTNLLKLRDGASSLLAGLIQLRDGANQLNSGLANDAAPGAKKLAAGAGDLADGLVRLNGGASDLSDGAGRLDSGATKLKVGAAQLNDGIDQLRAGVSALPTSVQTQLASNADYQRLLGALQAMVTGIGDGSSTGTDTLMGGLFQVRGGLRTPYGYAANDCIVALGGGTPTKCGVGDAAEFMAGLLPTKKASLDCASKILLDLTGGPAVPDACLAGLPLTSPLPDIVDPTTLVHNIGTQLAGSVTDLDGLISGLTGMKLGIDGQLIPGVNKIRKGLYNSPCDPSQTDKNAADFCGLSQGLQAVQAGVPQLVDALASSISQTLLAGVNQLDEGSSQLAAGAGDLAAGTGQLAAGADKLAAGAGDASDGGSQVADGANKLSDGLGTAADGSGQLADGLTTAADGAPQLVDGAQRLSTEGMGALKKAGKDTALNYGEMYAVIKAGSEKAHTNSMAYGAPAGAEGLTAYSFTIKGEDGEGTRNLTRALAGLVLLGLGGGVFALRRRAI